MRRVLLANDQTLRLTVVPGEAGVFSFLDFTSADEVRGYLAEYQADESAATELLSVGEAKNPEGMNAAELAAWTSVCRVVLNLHETVTRN